MQYKHRGQKDEVVCEGSASMTEEQHKVVSDAMRNSLDTSGPPTVKRKKLDPQTKQLTQDHPARKSPLRAAPGQTLGSPSAEWTPYRGEHPVGPRGEFSGTPSLPKCRGLREVVGCSGRGAFQCRRQEEKQAAEALAAAQTSRGNSCKATKRLLDRVTSEAPGPCTLLEAAVELQDALRPSRPHELVGLLHTGSCAPGDPHVSAVSS